MRGQFRRRAKGRFIWGPVIAGVLVTASVAAVGSVVVFGRKQTPPYTPFAQANLLSSQGDNFRKAADCIAQKLNIESGKVSINTTRIHRNSEGFLVSSLEATVALDKDKNILLDAMAVEDGKLAIPPITNRQPSLNINSISLDRREDQVVEMFGMQIQLEKKLLNRLKIGELPIELSGTIYHGIAADLPLELESIKTSSSNHFLDLPPDETEARKLQAARCLLREHPKV